MDKSLRQLSPKSETAAAIRYALSRWRALGRYVDDGLLEIDNNPAERALRCVALGRKNYLFAGADEGGSYCPSRYLLINRGFADVDREMTEFALVDSRLHTAHCQYAEPLPG